MAPRPVLEIDADGTKRWRVDGVLHREDGPAIEESDGVRYWYRHGKAHSEDGPAVEYPSGIIEWCPNGGEEWWLNGEQYTKPAWLHELLKDRPLTTRQRELLCALSENWDGTPELLYETVTHLSSSPDSPAC